MNKRIISAIVFLLALVNQVSAEDNMTINDFVISAGETKELSITLENEVVYAGFQFDLYLPKGMSVSEYSKDQARIPEETSLSMARQKDGSYRFIAVAMQANPIFGTSGGIVTVKVTASEDLANGSQTGYFRKVKLSKTDGTGNIYTEMSFPITVLEPSTVKAKSYERMYGEGNPEFEFDVEGGALDGTPEISCEATATSPVGTYDIIVKRGTETNYNVTYTKGTLTITKAPLTIKAGEYTRKQGEDNPEFTLTYDGFKNNENEEVLTRMPEVTCEADMDSEAGEYKVTISGAEAQNYEITYKEGKLTVTAPEQTIIQGDANGDGTVNAADIVEVVNFIMGHPSAKFKEDAADANGDGVVNAADIVAIVNIIMGN